MIYKTEKHKKKISPFVHCILIRVFLKVVNLCLIGTSVLQVTAYDGDYAHPRRLRYGLDPTDLPFSSYFDIDPDQGIVKVRKSLQVQHNSHIACHKNQRLL